MDKKLNKAIKLLEAEAKQLNRWAKESLSGGWSTHQVEPMRKRAIFLRKRVKGLKK